MPAGAEPVRRWRGRAPRPRRRPRGTLITSVPDPDPFGLPGSGSISQRYGSGCFHHQAKISHQCCGSGSVGSICFWGLPGPDPLVRGTDPDPLDLYVFWPSGSGCNSQRCGSRSFHHQAKIVRKTLIPTVLRLLFDFFFIFEKWCKWTFKN